MIPGRVAPGQWGFRRPDHRNSCNAEDETVRKLVVLDLLPASISFANVDPHSEHDGGDGAEEVVNHGQDNPLACEMAPPGA